MVNKSTLVMRDWRSKNKEKWQAYMKKWREDHREQRKKSRHQYYLDHKDKEIRDSMDWQKRHPLLSKASKTAISIRKRYGGISSMNLVLDVFKRNNFTCHWCGKQDLDGWNLTIEHLKPNNNPESLTVACRSCNSKKFVGKKGGKKVV